jgi:hypothetical protein
MQSDYPVTAALTLRVCAACNQASRKCTSQQEWCYTVPRSATYDRALAALLRLYTHASLEGVLVEATPACVCCASGIRVDQGEVVALIGHKHSQALVGIDHPAEGIEVLREVLRDDLHMQRSESAAEWCSTQLELAMQSAGILAHAAVCYKASGLASCSRACAIH